MSANITKKKEFKVIKQNKNNKAEINPKLVHILARYCLKQLSKKN